MSGIVNRRNLGSSIILVISGVLAISSSFISFKLTVPKDTKQASFDSGMRDEVASIMKTIANINKEVEVTSSIVNTAINNESEQNGNLRISKIEEDITMINKRISDINEMIASSPEKAILLPLMKKDIDYNRDRLTEIMGSINKDIERAYSLFMWIVGTLAFSIFGIIITLFLNSKQK